MASLVERESSFCDKEFQGNILRALYEQREKAIFCDIVMRICGKEMYAHSAVLAAASPYFNVFLSHDLPRQFSQRSPQIIEIQIDGSTSSGMYAAAVTAVLDFIYTGTLHLTSSTVVEVSDLARIMQIDKVLGFCEDFLVSRSPSSPETPGVTVMYNRGVNTESDVALIKLGPNNKGLSHSQLLTSALAMIDSKSRLGSKQTQNLHQKQYKAGKQVSTSTQVNPCLLGIKPPQPKVTKDEKTQTSDAYFSVKAESPVVSGGLRKETQTMPDDTNDSEIVMEITRTKQKSTSVRIVKLEKTSSTTTEDTANTLNEVSEPGRGQNDGEQPLEQLGQRDDVEHPLPQEMEIDEVYDIYANNDKCTRRSYRQPKPTAKILALQKKKVPVRLKKQSVTDKDQAPPPETPSETDHIAQQTHTEASQELEEKVQGKQVGALKVETEEDKASDVHTGGGRETIEEQAEPEAEPSPRQVAGRGRGRNKRWVPVTATSGRLSGSKRRIKGETNFKFTCSECFFHTNKVRQFANHKRLHKMEKNICYYCEEKFAAKDDLVRHLERHSGPLPYFCPLCDGRYKSRTQLNIHLPKHSDDKPFVCEVCGAGFKWKHALKNHMIVHSNRKDHLCDECGYATAHKCQLKAHMLIHTGNTFRCPFVDCRFQATKRQNLKYHILTHTREKPHVCDVCGQSFSLIKNMRRHMLLHSADKRRQCDQCDFSTTRYDKLKEHMLRLHGMGTPPEKRVRVADLVQRNYLEPSLTEAEREEPAEVATDDLRGLMPPPPPPAAPPMDIVQEAAVVEEDAGTASATEVLKEAGGEEPMVMVDGGDPQTVQFLPGQTLIITQAGEDGEVQTHQVRLPLAPSPLEGDPGIHLTEVLVPAEQLTDYVTFLAQS